MGYKLVDLSQEIYTGAPVWPGHPKTKVTVIDTHESTPGIRPVHRTIMALRPKRSR